jgi:transposase
MSRRKRRQFTEEFKTQMVQMYNNGKGINEIVKEYDLTRSALERWISNYNKTGSFKAKDNRTDLENEVLRLQKELKYAKMENDILKQAALILGQKSK